MGKEPGMDAEGYTKETAVKLKLENYNSMMGY